MNLQVLSKFNSFIKARLIELFGSFLILLSLFLFVSTISYSPSDPNFIYTPESSEIKNVGGFYGSVISDFLLQSIGFISFLLMITISEWGFRLMVQKKIYNISLKIFFILLYITFGTTFINVSFNNSFWLIDNGNSGFV